MPADLVNSDLAHGDSMPVCLTGLFISYARGCARTNAAAFAEHCGRRVGVPANNGVGIIDAAAARSPSTPRTRSWKSQDRREASCASCTREVRPSFVPLPGIDPGPR